MLTPNPNECNSTLMSGTNNIYPYPYIDVNDWGHCFRSGTPLMNYPHTLVIDLKEVLKPGFHQTVMPPWNIVQFKHVLTYC